MAGKKPAQTIEAYLDPLKFYNHGDNPAMKNFMKIAMENAKDSILIDHRTFAIDKGQRFILARNWDDFLQRDLGAITFPRAFGIFLINTMFLLSSVKITRNLIPIGRFGIRSITETPIYHNFGVIGVTGALLFGFTGVYTWYKTFKFTLHKFYRHVLMGQRNWFLEERKNTQRDGSYQFSDNLLGNQNNFPKSTAQKFATSGKRDWKPTYTGPYGEYTKTESKPKK